MSPFNRHYLLTAALCSVTGLSLFSSVAAADETETFKSVAGLLGPTGQADSIALPSFDSSMGTLESVYVTMQFNICPTITVDNSTTAPITFSGLSVSAPFNVSGPGGLTYSSTLGTYSVSGTAAPGSTDYTPTEGWLYTTRTATTNLNVWENQPDSNIDLVVTPGNLVTKTGSSAGLQVSSTALEWENISVTYTYLDAAAVPEPSGKYLAFIVGTAMALFVIRRRVQLGA